MTFLQLGHQQGIPSISEIRREKSSEGCDKSLTVQQWYLHLFSISPMCPLEIQMKEQGAGPQEIEECAICQL
jgi:hypothetical protein